MSMSGMSPETSSSPPWRSKLRVTSCHQDPSQRSSKSLMASQSFTIQVKWATKLMALEVAIAETSEKFIRTTSMAKLASRGSSRSPEATTHQPTSISSTSRVEFLTRAVLGSTLPRTTALTPECSALKATWTKRLARDNTTVDAPTLTRT